MCITFVLSTVASDRMRSRAKLDDPADGDSVLPSFDCHCSLLLLGGYDRDRLSSTYSRYSIVVDRL